MEKLHKAIIRLMSAIGLFLGGWFGYEFAGPIGVLLFVPLGTPAGLIMGVLNWRLILLLA